VGATGPVGPVGGSDKQILYNAAGDASGSPALTFDYTTNILEMNAAPGTIQLNPANESLSVSNGSGAYAQIGAGNVSVSDGGSVFVAMDGLTSNITLDNGAGNTIILDNSIPNIALALGTGIATLAPTTFDLTDVSNNVNLNAGIPSMLVSDGTNTSSVLAGSMTVTLPPTADDQLTRKDYVDSVAIPAITVQAASGTIALTPAMNRSTYILTGTSATQTFDPAGLAGEPAGFCVYLRNGNNAFGTTNDINIAITGVVGAFPLHTIGTTTNAGTMLLYWNGSVLTRYR
jgi:hypothetical protein